MTAKWTSCFISSGNRIRRRDHDFKRPLINRAHKIGVKFSHSLRRVDRFNVLTNLSRPDAQSQYYEGDLLFRLGQLSEAKVFLEKSIALDSKLSESQVSLGVVRMAERQEAEAEKLFKS